MKDVSEILKTEYSEHFDDLRKNRVKVSYFKYGPSKINFGERIVSSLGSMKKCVDKYVDTGNTEYLCDAANYLMFEFMYPTHEKAFFEATGPEKSAGIDGMSINQINEMENN